MNADWLQRLHDRVNAPPTQPRLPLALVVGGGAPRAIGSIESTLALGLAGAGLPLRDTCDAWQIELPSGSMADATFAAIADQMRADGRASAWRNELLDVRDDAGCRLGAIERAAVRPLGITSHAVHLVVRDDKGSVWVQQRSFDKAVDPGLWDTTVGGLVSAHESALETLARETWEEAGLRLEQLRSIEPFCRFTARRPLAEGYMVEHIEMFEAEAQRGVTPSNRDGEVARFECVDGATLISRLEADAFTLEAAMILVRWLDRRLQSHL